RAAAAGISHIHCRSRTGLPPSDWGYACWHTFGTKAFHTRDSCPATVAVMAKAATPWGPAELLEELTLTQRAGDKRFSSMVQLLEAPGGERLVRFAYATSGTARRGPVTLRARDLDRLRAGLAQRPGLAAAVGLNRPKQRRAAARERR